MRSLRESPGCAVPSGWRNILRAYIEAELAPYLASASQAMPARAGARPPPDFYTRGNVDRTLSSPATPLLKFVLPPIWTAILGYGTYQLWTNPAEVVYNGVKGAATASTQWTFSAPLSWGVIYLCWWCLPLKRVVLSGGSLRISNFRSEVVVPVRTIEAVSQSLLSGRLITLHLRTDSQFGDRITFLPNTHRRLAFWCEDELVGELRQLAGIERSSHERSSAAARPTPPVSPRSPRSRNTAPRSPRT